MSTIRTSPAVPRREMVAQATALAEQEDIPEPALIGAESFRAVAAVLDENRRHTTASR